MSTRGSKDAPASTGFKIRPQWILTGGVLWSCVFALLWAGWRQERGADTIASERTGQNISSRRDENDAPAPKVVTLPISSNSDDDQVIDLSALMNSSNPTPQQSAWDPAGVEDFTFINLDGREISKADLLGRPWAICFVFTKCLGPCPTVTKQLRDLQLRLKAYDYRLVTLTVDPARDTPEVLSKYAKIAGADTSNWYFLTGDQNEIYGLIQRSFKMPVQETFGPNRKEGFEIIHSTNVMLVNAEGVVQGKFNAAKDDEMAQLRRELQAIAMKIPVAEAPLPDTPIAERD